MILKVSIKIHCCENDVDGDQNFLSGFNNERHLSLSLQTDAPCHIRTRVSTQFRVGARSTGGDTLTRLANS
jgi:hypothetical protein